MKSNRFLRYAAIVSLLACAACKPQSIPYFDDAHVDLSASAAPAAVDAAKVAVASVRTAH
ncbi:hypothetical protein [Lysobacter enzymogenes]|uniref:Lipoprotein n=1 Tax=Lysobacter enzymogenes TaxID=69 RepID=A0A3N2RFF6_LYSEN|nr:hypothetical protein [Lysobacter enzymogenes]ROU06124.1 hypothetical protein D9T17_15660 [Lysobacter enzymogenes]